MSFVDYFWELLTKFLKATWESQLKIWIRTLGEKFDALKQSIFALRRNWLIKTATGEALDLHGEARWIKRKPGEPDDIYRNLVMDAFNYYVAAGTRKAIEEAIADITTVPFTIKEYQRECWKLGRPGYSRLGVNTRLMSTRAVAAFGVYFDQPLSPDIEARVRQMLDELSPAHITFGIFYPSIW
ncbi:MAG: phage tail protein [Firmicutes bacterium]|nr:phage tail protein [Bacillota bacterium]